MGRRPINPPASRRCCDREQSLLRGFYERDGRERPHVDKNPAYAVNPESERAENRDVLTCDLVNSRFARLKMQSGADCFPRRTQVEENLPAVLPAIGLSCNDFQ